MLYIVVQPLKDEEKGAMLIEQAQQRGFDLPVDVMRYVLHHAPRDMPSLLSLFDELDKLSLQTQRRITVPLVKTLL